MLFIGLIMKIIYLSLLLCFSTGLAFPQTFPDDAIKQRSLYDQALTQQSDLEAKAQYNGDDVIVRNRFNLPPKLPSFENWVKSNIQTGNQPLDSKSLQVHTNVETGTEKAIDISTTNNVITIQPEKTVENNVKKPSESEKQQVKTATNSSLAAPNVIAIIIGIMMFSAAFSAYIVLPKKYRIATISTPFDIGLKKEELSEAEVITKSKRQKIEFCLLLVSIFVYFYILINSNSNSLSDVLFEPIFLFLIPYSIVVIGRMIYGHTTKCPSCKNTFASNLVSSHREPRTTYRKKISDGTNGATYAVMETGVEHEEFECTVCEYEWQVDSQYTIEVSRDNPPSM